MPEASVGVIECVLAFAVQLCLAPREVPGVPLVAGLVYPLASLSTVLHQEPSGDLLPPQDGYSVMTVICRETWMAKIQQENIRMIFYLRCQRGLGPHPP